MYGQPGPSPQQRELDAQSQTWLIVAAIGFWVGFGLITGPLAWIYGSKLRNQYRALGLPPSTNATGAFVIGIISTALYVMSFIGLVMMFMFWAAMLGLSS